MNFFIKLVLSISLTACILGLSVAVAKSSDYEAAVQAYYADNIDAAFIHLKNVLQEDKNNLPAKLLLAEVFIKKQLFSSAEQELNDAILQGADINLIIGPLGRALLLQGKFKLVLQLSEDRQLHKQGELAFNLIKAKAYLGLSDVNSAEDLYLAILLTYPNNVEATLELASIYNVKNQVEKAQKLLDKATLLAPENSRLWQIKGQLARNQGQLEDSINYLSKADGLEPNNITTLKSLATSYIELQEPEKAQSLIEQVLLSSPKDMQAQLTYSNILSSLNKKKLSAEVLVKLTNQLSSIDESYMLSQPQLLLIDAMSSYGQEQWLQAQKKLKLYINQGLDTNDMSAVVLLADVYVKLSQPELALKLLASYESHLLKNKDHALILAGLYLQFNQNFKADYVLKKLQNLYSQDEDVIILSAKVLSNTDQDKEALVLLESAKIAGGDRYKQALTVTALRLGDLEKSFTYAKSLISSAPDVPEYQLLYVQVLLQLKQFNEVEKVVVDLHKKHPENKNVQFSYAMLQFSLGNASTAKALFTELVTKNPDDSESWFALAQIAYDSGEIDESIAILERQSKNSVFRNKALHKLANIYYSQQQFDKSLLVINMLLQTSRLDTKAIQLKAKNLIALNQTKEAKHQLDILLGMWGDDARKLFELSQLQLRVNDAIGAEKSLDMAYSIEPRALPIIIDIIKVKIRLNKLTQASALLVKGEKAGYKDNIYFTILKGDVEVAKNNASTAFNHYLAALNKDDTNIIALVKLSQVSHLKNLSNKFIVKLTSLVEKYPERAIQRHTFADHLFEQNKLEQARFQYQRLIMQDIPSEKRAWALNNLAIIYQRENSYQAAADVSQQAFAMLPNPIIIDTLGWSLTLLGDVEKGLAYLRQAFSMLSTDPRIQYHIAYALVKLNRQEEAKILLLSITKLPNNFEEHKLAEQLLNSL